MIIIGPAMSSATKGAQFACSALHMPQIAPLASDPSLVNNPSYNYLLRMLPAATAESTTIASIISHFGWTKMSILTSNTDFGKLKLYKIILL